MKCRARPGSCRKHAAVVEECCVALCARGTGAQRRAAPRRLGAADRGGSAWLLLRTQRGGRLVPEAAVQQQGRCRCKHGRQGIGHGCYLHALEQQPNAMAGARLRQFMRRRVIGKLSGIGPGRIGLRQPQHVQARRCIRNVQRNPEVPALMSSCLKSARSSAPAGGSRPSSRRLAWPGGASRRPAWCSGRPERDDVDGLPANSSKVMMRPRSRWWRRVYFLPCW